MFRVLGERCYEEKQRRDRIEDPGCMSEWCKQDEIVYQANLNFRTVNPYLDLLIEKNLIRVSQGQIPLYETTPQGIDMLEDIKEVHNGLLC